MSAVAAGGEFSGATAGLYARNPAIPAATVRTGRGAAGRRQARRGVGAGREHPGCRHPRVRGGLTPVLLRADTAVTAFGYDDPAFFSYPAVLQAGTAVLINGSRGAHGQVLQRQPAGEPGAARADGGAHRVLRRPAVDDLPHHVGDRRPTLDDDQQDVLRRRHGCRRRRRHRRERCRRRPGRQRGQRHRRCRMPDRARWSQDGRLQQAAGGPPAAPRRPRRPPTGPGNCTKNPTATGCAPRARCDKDPKRRCRGRPAMRQGPEGHRLPGCACDAAGGLCEGPEGRRLPGCACDARRWIV